MCYDLLHILLTITSPPITFSDPGISQELPAHFIRAEVADCPQALLSHHQRNQPVDAQRLSQHWARAKQRHKHTSKFTRAHMQQKIIEDAVISFHPFQNGAIINSYQNSLI